MPEDKGHELTDDILVNMEKKIAKVYRKANREIEEKLQIYLKQFAEKDEKKLALVKSGKLSEKDYKNWRQSQIIISQRWQNMLDKLATDYKNTNKIARSVIKGYMPEVYALNHNYGTYQIEKNGKINTNYTLYDAQTVENLIKNNPDLLPAVKEESKTAEKIRENKDWRWNKQKINSAVTQGVLQGESMNKIAKRIERVTTMNYSSAIRNARTATTSAENAGRYNAYRRADKIGVDLTIEWAATLDGRTRHEHRMLHGQRRKIDEPFEVDGFKIMWPAQSHGPGASDIPQRLIWNCFVGDTKVASDCEIVRSYKHKFKGNLIRVRTAAGVDFTCTPNHPILTPNGWIPAAFLHKGDHLLITRVGDDGSLTRNGNVYHVHSSIKALHDSLESLGNSERISMSNFDFHGDVPTSDVEVVSKERLLRNDRNTCGGQSSRKIRFKLSNAFHLCERHFMLGFRRIYISSLRFVRGCCKPLTLIWRRLRHSDIHGFGTVSNRNTFVSEYAINDLPTVTNIRSELLDGLAGNVFVDDVVSVDRKPGRLLCHVYNLQTESGYYFVGNSIPQNGEKYNGNYYAIAKNCRCTLLAWVKGFEGRTVKSSPKIGGMSFDEWLNAKPQPKSTKKR